MEIQNSNKIILTRKKEFNNRLRNIIVLIDDEKKIKLLNQEKNVTIEESQTVRLKAKIDWCYSPEIVVSFDNTGLNKKVMVSSQISNIYMTLIFVCALLGGILTILKGNWMFMIPFFVLYLKPLYFITIGRKQYLRINLIDEGLNANL